MKKCTTLAAIVLLAAAVTSCRAVEAQAVAVAGAAAVDDPIAVGDAAYGAESSGRRGMGRTKTPGPQTGTLISCWQRGTKVLNEHLGQATGPTPAGALALEGPDGRRWVVMGLGDALCIIESEVPAAVKTLRDGSRQ